MSQAGGYDTYAFTAELYDHVIPYRERQDIAFYVNAAREANGPVLEVGCGTGRVLIPTARAGVDITGHDLSVYMLDVCRKRLANEPDEIQTKTHLVQADMRDFDLARRFSLVTIPFRPFQHLETVDDQLSCLACIRRHLMDGGRLIFDLFNPSLEALTANNIGEELGDEPEFIMDDGRCVLRRYRTLKRDRFNQINYVEFIYRVTYPDGRKEQSLHSFTMRYLYRFEAEHLLARSGFDVEAVYADFTKSPYGSQYPGDLIFVARKAD